MVADDGTTSELTQEQLSELWLNVTGELQAGSVHPDQLNNLADVSEKIFELPFVNRKQKQLYGRKLTALLTEGSDDLQTVLGVARLCRILSRISTDIDALADESLIVVAGRLCGYESGKQPDKCSRKVRLELQKCLCNLAFQHPQTRLWFKNHEYFNGLLILINEYSQQPSELLLKRREIIRWRQMYSSISGNCSTEAMDQHNRRLYDLKLFFILTATTMEMRKIAHKNENTIESLTCLLEQIVKRPDNEDKKLILCLEDSDIMGEILKCLFNVITETDWLNAKIMSEDDATVCKRLCLCCRRVLSMTVPTAVQVQHLTGSISQATNIFTLMPSSALIHVTDPDLDISDRRPVMFHGRNMAALLTVVELLEFRLKNTDSHIVPVLCVLTWFARLDHKHRKYIRFKLLPPMRDEVLRRPEEGDTYRNALVRLMTDVSSASQASAELIFELCKRNVGRIIKYTGYGNAAGLLANHGLLSGASNQQDSDDSDTEEYEQLKHKVNPVTGFVQEEGPNAMEGMSDEQKEYEAMKLVEHLDKLMNQGVIKPGTVGEDGKPRALEHILELTKNVKDEQEDSD